MNTELAPTCLGMRTGRRRLVPPSFRALVRRRAPPHPCPRIRCRRCVRGPLHEHPADRAGELPVDVLDEPGRGALCACSRRGRGGRGQLAERVASRTNDRELRLQPRRVLASFGGRGRGRDLPRRVRFRSGGRTTARTGDDRPVQRAPRPDDCGRTTRCHTACPARPEASCRARGEAAFGVERRGERSDCEGCDRAARPCRRHRRGHHRCRARVGASGMYRLGEASVGRRRRVAVSDSGNGAAAPRGSRSTRAVIESH